MDFLGGIKRFFFQKTTSDFDANEALRRNQTRYNALYALDPNVLVRHLEAFQRGDICGLERIIDEFETREDKMRIGSFKMASAVASKPWTVRIRQGEEENPRAKLHQEHLTRFWNRIEATDAFCRNRKGGMRLLVKQMMSAQSRVYSVHDICWRVNPDGTLSAVFTHVPAWCFENRTGRLRYIKNDCDSHGVEMPDGEWLVAVGEGVGIAAAVIAMAKRLSWNDWLLFSEKCGMPVILGNTNAQRGTDAWNAMARAIRAIAPKTGLLADTGTTLNAVSMGAGGQQTYRELVDSVDRAISALYRGGDLATVSSGPDAAGVNAQAGESELMDDDGCKMVAETLRDQVEKFVIRFELGDFEPLAEIVINPPADVEDVERDMAIDNHLAGLGVRLSKKDALQRYGRSEAEDEKDALSPPQTAPQGAFAALANENNPKTPLQSVAKPLQNAEKQKDAQGEGEAEDALVGALERVFAKSLAEGVAKGLEGEGANDAEDDEALANAVDANGMEHAEAGDANGGQFVSKGGESSSASAGKPKIRTVKSSSAADTQAKACGYADVKDMMTKAEAVEEDRISAIREGFSGKCKAHEAIAVISQNIPFEDAEGNKVDFGRDIIEHYVEGRRRRDNEPKVANLEDLPYAIKAVKSDTYGVTRLKYPHGTTPDPLNPPRGTQREYHLTTDHGQMKVFVYIQGGHINGWHVAQ